MSREHVLWQKIRWCLKKKKVGSYWNYSGINRKELPMVSVRIIWTTDWLYKSSTPQLNASKGVVLGHLGQKNKFLELSPEDIKMQSLVYIFIFMKIVLLHYHNETQIMSHSVNIYSYMEYEERSKILNLKGN